MCLFTSWGSRVQPPQGPTWSDHPSKYQLVRDGDYVYLQQHDTWTQLLNIDINWHRNYLNAPKVYGHKLQSKINERAWKDTFLLVLLLHFGGCLRRVSLCSGPAGPSISPFCFRCSFVVQWASCWPFSPSRSTLLLPSLSTGIYPTVPLADRGTTGGTLFTLLR